MPGTLLVASSKLAVESADSRTVREKRTRVVYGTHAAGAPVVCVTVVRIGVTTATEAVP